MILTDEEIYKMFPDESNKSGMQIGGIMPYSQYRRYGAKVVRNLYEEMIIKKNRQITDLEDHNNYLLQKANELKHKISILENDIKGWKEAVERIESYNRELQDQKQMFQEIAEENAKEIVNLELKLNG